MFERFTENARTTVVLAQEEERELGHPFIGPEHLLLGVLRADGVSAVLVGDLGLRLEEVRAAVRERLGEPGEPVPASVPFAPAAKAVLETSLRIALERGDRHVGTEHLALALADEAGAAAALEACGVAPERVREAVSTLVATPDELGEPAAPRSGRGRLKLRPRRASQGERFAAALPPDPRDPDPPIEVRLGGHLLGDLGNARVDARLVLAIILRDGRVAAWLAERGIDEAAVRAGFGELELGFEPPEEEGRAPPE